jgi:hypothetical protein
MNLKAMMMWNFCKFTGIAALLLATVAACSFGGGGYGSNAANGITRGDRGGGSGTNGTPTNPSNQGGGQ